MGGSFIQDILFFSSPDVDKNKIKLANIILTTNKNECNYEECIIIDNKGLYGKNIISSNQKNYRL